ncbi:MAG: hypoxanthine phosphoribosyltransferase [Chloroflexi bacterium]|nr:MAG: hypoxanthine phosphoribosyltransferase [Chloroflexota bacterium]TMD65072.1 MAG: hypoxanthine phosphoribosyltransferase [Chloroflexota bacterium]
MLTTDLKLGRELVSADAIQRRVREMAAEISRDYARVDQPLILLPVLKGSVCFATDLSRHLEVPVNFDYVAVSSYGSGTESSGHVQLLKDLTMDVAGRDVLMVEDIIDTGLTTAFLFEHVQRHRPASLKLSVLLNKEERRIKPVPIAYKGFDIPNQFVVGYGLDYNELYRNLTAVHVLEP